MECEVHLLGLEVEGGAHSILPQCGYQGERHVPLGECTALLFSNSAFRIAWPSLGFSLLLSQQFP